MRAGPIVVGSLLQNRNRFCVPIYQRHYVWTKEKQWEPFWSDIRTKAIERLAGRERRFSHFMGAVVLEARGGFSARRVPSFQVVDGQQRLTTFQLFLAPAGDMPPQSVTVVARKRSRPICSTAIPTSWKNQKLKYSRFGLHSLIGPYSRTSSITLADGKP